MTSPGYQGTYHPFRVPFLDGLRGLAILSVILGHYLYQPANPGPWFAPIHHVLGASWVGVDLFFVLSGFLLGGILLENRLATNLFRVFYLRRACRILPPYLAFLSPLLLVPALNLAQHVPALGSLISTGAAPPWAFPLFLQNFFLSANGSWGEAWISTSWSLAVEEQFYLLLPFLIVFVPLRRLPAVLLMMVVLAPASRVALHLFADVPQARVGSYMLLICRWDALLMGVLAAWLVRDATASAWLREHTTRLRRGLGLLLLAGVTLAIVSPTLYSLPMQTFGYTLYAALFATAVLCGHFGVLPGQQFLRARWLRGLGRISYTLYLVHVPISCVFFHVIARHARSLNNPADLMLMAGSLIASVTVAALSWKFLERPILELGRNTPYRMAETVPANEALDAVPAR